MLRGIGELPPGFRVETAGEEWVIQRAMAMSPIESVEPKRSNTASQVVPLFRLRNTPPAALPTKIVRGSSASAFLPVFVVPQDDW
jgi:hypothetical protein